VSPLIQLTEGDIGICKVIAGLRTASARRGKRDNGFNLDYGKHSDNEEIGVLAEYNFCKHYNLFFDAVFGGRDDGSDCKLKGKKIDIKSIDKRNLNLICNLESKGEADIYVLVFVENYTCNIIGWIDCHALQQPCNIKNMGYGNRYFMEQGDLNEW
jgi:hypothetical protein